MSHVGTVKHVAILRVNSRTTLRDSKLCCCVFQWHSWYFVLSHFLFVFSFSCHFVFLINFIALYINFPPFVFVRVHIFVIVYFISTIGQGPSCCASVQYMSKRACIYCASLIYKLCKVLQSNWVWRIYNCYKCIHSWSVYVVSRYIRRISLYTGHSHTK